MRKGYLLISLKGDYSDHVAQKISRIKGITFVSLVTGSIDILCVCLFRDTNHLFRIIERVEKVSWSEEVRVIPAKEMTVSSLEAFINNSLESSDSYGSSNTESMS